LGEEQRDGSIFKSVQGNLAWQTMKKLSLRVKSSFYLRYGYYYRIKNIETGEVVIFHQNTERSPLSLPLSLLAEA